MATETRGSLEKCVETQRDMHKFDRHVTFRTRFDYEKTTSQGTSEWP